MNSSYRWWAWVVAMLLVVYAGCGNPKDPSSQGTVGEEQAAGKGDKQEVTPASDLAFVQPEHYFAIVFHPRRISELPPVAAQLKDEMVLEIIKTFPFDPANVEQVTILLSPPDKNAYSFVPGKPTVVLHFVQPVEVKSAMLQFQTTMLGGGMAKRPMGSAATKGSENGPKEIQCSGKSCYQFPAQPDWVAYAPNPTTMVIFEKPLLEKIVTGGEPKGPLAERLKKADADGDAVIAVALEAYPDLAARLEAQMSRQYDEYDPFPGEVTFVDTVKSLSGATASVHLKGETLLRLSIDAATPEGAESLAENATAFAKLADGFLVLMKKGLPAENKARFGAGMQWGADAFAGAQVTRNGAQLSVSLKSPPKLEEAVASLGEAFKELASERRQVEEHSRLAAVGKAIQAYDEANGSLPPRVMEKNGSPLLSWRVAILPQLNELDLYQQFHLDEPWDIAHNLDAAKKMPRVYQSANVSDKGESGKTRVIIFTGKGSLFDPDHKVRMRELHDYSHSETILCAEAGPDKAEFWTKPDDTPVDPKNPAATLGQVPRKGFNVATIGGWPWQVRTSRKSLFKMILPFAASPAEPKATGSTMKADWGEKTYSTPAAMPATKSTTTATALEPAEPAKPETATETPKFVPPADVTPAVPAPQMAPLPKVEPDLPNTSAAQKAIELYDANHDGFLDAKELERVPGLRAAMKQLVTNQGKITAEDIADRIKSWASSRIGRVAVVCRVTHNGKPLAGAKVVFVPEKFLGGTLQSGSGTTGVTGSAMISSPYPADPAVRGLSPGFYRVEITSDDENIPAKYNRETTLGAEVSGDNLGPSASFDLSY